MLHRSIAIGLLGLVVWNARGVAEEPPALPPVEVKLLEAGKQPRRMLRYRIKPGSTEEMVMGMKMATATEVSNQKLPAFQAPTMEMTMKIDIKEATGENIDYDFALTEAKVLEDEKVPDAVRKAMTDSLTRSVGIGGQASANDRGRTLAAKMNVPENSPPDVRQMIDSMQRSLQNFSAPLPDEPVGVGAQWEVNMTLEAGGLRMKQVAKYTLKELATDSFQADIAIKQTADKQEMKLPNLPKGTTVELQSLSGEGTGTTTAPLNHLAPESKMSLVTTVDAMISVNGMQQAMKSTNSVSIAIRPK